MNLYCITAGANLFHLLFMKSKIINREIANILPLWGARLN